MSSGAGEASGASGLDLNCDVLTILENHETGVEDGLEDAPVSAGGELLDRERGETMDVGGNEKKECERGIADREDGMMGNGDGSVGSELGLGNEVGVVGTIRSESGAESHVEKLLEAEFGEKGSTELVFVSTVGFNDVEASSQTLNMGDGSGGDQKRVADVDMKGVMGTDEVSPTVLVSGGGTEDEMLEGSSTSRKELAEVQVVDGGGELVDGQLNLEERELEGESIKVKLMEVDTVEDEIADLVTVSADTFEPVDDRNQAESLGNVTGGDQTQVIDVDAVGMVIDHQLGLGEREAEVMSHSGKFLEVEKVEDGSAELAVVSTEGFELVETSIPTVDFHDQSDGDQKRGTDLGVQFDLGEKGSADLDVEMNLKEKGSVELVAVSTVGFEAVEASGQAMYLRDGSNGDHNRVTDVYKEDMGGTDEDLSAVLVCCGGAEDERLEGSSNLREEQVVVDLADGGVQVEDQSGPEEREAEGKSICIKLLEKDTGGRESADLIAVSAEDFEDVEVSNQPVMERDTGGSESADLVAVSAEEFEAVEASNQPVNLGDGSGGDQKQGIDIDVEGMVIDGQLGPEEKDAEVNPYSGKFLEADKRGEENAVLVSVSTEEFRTVEASRHPMGFHDGSSGDQKRCNDLVAECMVIEVETPGGKLLDVDKGKNGSTLLVSVSTERFEHSKVCSQSMDLGDASGDDQRLGPGLDAEGILGINEDSVAVSVGSGGKLLEADFREKRSAEQVAVTTEGFEPDKTSSQAINLVHISGDDQRLVTDVDAEGMVGINEDPVTISVGSGGREDERSEASLVLKKEQVEVQCGSSDGRGQAVDVELDTGKREAEFKSYCGGCMKVDMGEKRSAMLVGSLTELSEAIEASSEAMNLGDGSDGDQNRGVDLFTEDLKGTDEVSLTVLVVGGGRDNEKMEGSSILRSEQFEIQVDLVDESDQAADTRLGCGEREAEVYSHEGMPLYLHSGEKESTNLVGASAEEFKAIEASNQAMNLGYGSGTDQIQGIDADAEDMDLDVQLGPGERDTEVKSHSRKVLELDKKEKESAEPVAVSTEIFEPVETSSLATDIGDGSDGDENRGTEVNADGVAIDDELSLGKGVAEGESHGEKFLGVDRDDKGSAELPDLSTERFLPCKACSEPMNLVDGCGGDQRLDTDVDAVALDKTDEDSVAISIASGAPEDARLEGSLILGKEHKEVQCNLVDGIGEVVEGELGTAISLAEVKSYGERCMEVDMGEKGSTKLGAASTEWSESVEASSQAMELGDGSGSDQIQGTDADAEGMVGIEDSVTVLVVGGAPGNERLEGSLASGKEQVEVLVHAVDGCGQAENELVSHDGKLLGVELGENRKEVIAASAERFEVVEVSCQAMDSGDRFGGDQKHGIDVNAEDMIDISADSAVVSGGVGGPEDERLEEESSVLGVELAETMRKSVDGCIQVVDSKLIHGERTPNVESHGQLLKVETGVDGGAEVYAISAEGFQAVEGCIQAMDLHHGSGGDQKQEADVDAVYVVGTSGDSVNVSGAYGGPEDENLERSLLLEKEPIEFLQDLMDGHNQVLDGEFGPGQREAEVEPHSRKLFELDAREKDSAELVFVPAGGSGAVMASSQDTDLEDSYTSEQKQEIIVGTACIVRTDESSVVVSDDGLRPENEMLNGSSNWVKEVEVGEETYGSGSTMKDITESKKNQSAGYGTMIHAAQVQSEFKGGQRHDTDVGVEAMVGGTKQATLAVSVGGGGPEDERSETSYKFGEKQVDVGEDNTGPGTPEKKLAHPQKIGGAGVDAMRDTGHFNDTVQGRHVDSREKIDGDQRAESCMETDVEPFVVAVAYQGAEAQVLEVAPLSDGKQVKFKCGNDESQIVEKVVHFQKSGDSVNEDACDLVEGHPDEREGEVVGDDGHNISEVNSEFSAGVENMIEKGLTCLPEYVEALHDLMDNALDDRDPGSDGYDQETVVTYTKQDFNLESFQGSGLELMGMETGICHPSTVGSERVEVLTQASSVDNNQNIHDENITVAGETVQKLDSIPIIEEKDTGLQQVDANVKSTVVRGSTVVCFDVAKIAMTLDAAVNVEVRSSNEHTAVDNMVEKENVLLEDNTSVTSAELLNVDAQLNFDYQNQKIESSPLLVPCREEEAHVAGPHSLDYSIMDDSNALLGISIPVSSAEVENLTITPQWNESSVGCEDVRPPIIPSTEHEELEPQQGTPALESALHAMDEPIDCSQKLQDGTLENLKELKNQSEGYDGTSTESDSTSQRATYFLSFPEKDGFSTFDLVWGKVKSHPWWPGQIFDFSGASQLAIKYQKKDHFLVAYFGDKTFAWCEESRLKPFHLCFSQMEKQTSSDSFLRALNDILVEISRRVKLSMICSCLQEETYADIKYQKVENAGVRGKIANSVFDRCEIVNYFYPDQFLEYVRELAQIPTGGADRLELTVALAQLKAFYLLKGYTELPAFTNGSGLVENDVETPPAMIKKLNEDDLEHSATLSDLFSTKGKLRSRDGTLGKQKQIVEDGRKQKSLSELMEEETTFLLVNRHENTSEVQDGENCLSSFNKRKALDYVCTDIGRSKTKRIDSQADEETKLPSPTSNSSFKVGAFISRAASKLTSGQPIRKCQGETSEKGLSKTDDWSVDYMDLDDFLDVPFEYPKLQIDFSGDYPPTNEMLSKLCLAARNPLKGYNFSSIVINFFCTYRNVQVSNISIEKNKTEKPRAKRGRKKKIIFDLESPDISTPDHMKDSYWSDMIIPEKDVPLNPPKRRGRKKRKFIDESSPSLMLSSPSDCEPKLHTGTMCPHVKHILTAERPIISVEEKIVDERTPTAVILYFNSSNSLPSEMDLIRIFSRYGPLKEEETYIERKNNSAMVVFKKRTDAEMAFSSAGKFSTFGPALLSYRLRHFPSKSSPVNTLIGEDDATPIKYGHLEILAEPEFNGALDGNLCEAAGKESSTFVQSQGHFGPALEMAPGGAGEVSELARYQAGDIVVSDSEPANTGGKEPLQDVPAQMETGEGSDHIMLESLDQEFSYFDLDQAEAGDISGTEVGGEESSVLGTIEVSHTANDISLGEESCDPVTGTSDSLEEQLENGTVLETNTQLKAVDEEFSGSAPPPEANDVPDEFNITQQQQPGEKECSDSPPAHVCAGTSEQSSVTIDVQSMEADSCAEQREVITVPDSTHIELERQDPSVSVMEEVCISEQRII